MEWFKFRMSWRKPMQKMSNEEMGEVLRALLDYVYTEEEQEISGRGDILLCEMTGVLQEDIRQFREKAEKKRLSALHATRCRWEHRDPETDEEDPETEQEDPETDNGDPETETENPETDVADPEPCGTHPHGTPECKKQNKKKNKKQNSETEKETDTEAETEKELYNYSPELLAAPELPAAEIPLNDGSEYPLFRKDLDDFAALYPAVNIAQELRNMRGWCLANPTRRKTRRGVRRFINGWLAKVQDRGGTGGTVPVTENPFLAYATGEKKIGEFML